MSSRPALTGSIRHQVWAHHLSIGAASSGRLLLLPLLRLRLLLLLLLLLLGSGCWPIPGLGGCGVGGSSPDGGVVRLC